MDIFWGVVVVLALSAGAWGAWRWGEMREVWVMLALAAVVYTVLMVYTGHGTHHPVSATISWALVAVALAALVHWLGSIGTAPTPIEAGDVTGAAQGLKRLAEPFDPEPLIMKAPRGQIFLGLDGTRRPVYVPQHVVSKTHIEILGESGTGKSSLAGVLLSQLAALGECVVVLDPKADRHLPGALARQAHARGYPFHIVDLRPQAGVPQLNPFAGCRADQVEELLQVALELGKTGDGGVDFYRGKDREATTFIAEAVADGRTDMLEIVEKARADERVTEQENLWRELRQLARVRALHTESGLDLREVLSRPGVLYVVGSTTRLEVVAAQKIILQRVLQILDERRDQSMPVCLFLDELKYILSPAALRAAGTIRDRGCHLIFAHQSLGDLDDCPGLSPKAVRGAIWGNSGVKIVYRMLDAQTAQELSRIAGQREVVTTTTTESDHGTSKSSRVERRDYMPAHVFTHLPKPSAGEASVGVVLGLGPAWYLATRYISSGPCPEPVPAPERRQSAGAAPDVPAPGAPTRRDDDDLSDLER